MRRYVVGLDGSPAAQTAMRWTLYLAERTHASVKALHALDDAFAAASSIDDARAALAHWAHVADSETPIVTELASGDPRKAIAAVVASEHPDLLVLGRTGQDRDPASTHLGGVVDYAAHHTRSPLAVIPYGVTPRIERIVLGVDGSRESMAAVTWCAEYARLLDAEVVAVEVRPPEVVWPPDDSDTRVRAAVEHEIDTWTAPLREAEVGVQHMALIHQHPAEGLLRAALARRADLIVVGSRGSGGFLGLQLGGVAMKLLHLSSIPLLIVGWGA